MDQQVKGHIAHIERGTADSHNTIELLRGLSISVEFQAETIATLRTKLATARAALGLVAPTIDLEYPDNTPVLFNIHLGPNSEHLIPGPSWGHFRAARKAYEDTTP